MAIPLEWRPMNEPVIQCPACRSEIKLTESLAAPLIAETRRQFEQTLAAKDTEVAKREAALKTKEGELAAAKASIEEQVAAKVEAGRDAIAADEAKKARLLAASDLEQKSKQLDELQDVPHGMDFLHPRHAPAPAARSPSSPSARHPRSCFSSSAAHPR